jgi:hypothetical protein
MKTPRFRRFLTPALCCVWLVAGRTGAATRSPEDIPMSYDQEMRAAEKARGSDPAWQPAFGEVAVIPVGKSAKGGSVHNYCLNADGNLLICCGGQFNRRVDDRTGRTESVTEPAEIRVYSAEGRLLKTWPQAAKLEAICVDRSGAIFAAGSGRIVRLDQDGKVVATADSPVANEPVVIGKEIEDMVKQQNRVSARDLPKELEKMKQMLERRRASITGIAATDQDVFVACPAPNDFTYRVYRFDHNLKNARLVVEKLRGCCGQMDIQAAGDKLWIPHNARHRVECRDRDGKEVSAFGKRGRVKPEQFGGCCEPKNLRLTRTGEILAAESGPPTCIKRFSADGKFLGVVALSGSMKGDCVRVTVEVSPDGKRFYLLDTTKDVIRVYGQKG